MCLLHRHSGIAFPRVLLSIGGSRRRKNSQRPTDRDSGPLSLARSRYHTHSPLICQHGLRRFFCRKTAVFRQVRKDRNIPFARAGKEKKLASRMIARAGLPDFTIARAPVSSPAPSPIPPPAHPPRGDRESPPIPGPPSGVARGRNFSHTATRKKLTAEK